MPVRDTSKMDPYEVLARAFSAKRPGGDIEQIEKEGQRDLCRCGDSLPADMGGADPKLEALGVVLGPRYEDDPVFRRAALPPGWRLVPTDHDMWSQLRDSENRVVATVFYKAAYYDRQAFLRLEGE